MRSLSESLRTGRGAWPVLLLLAVAVAVPTVCVLWFMSQAVRNERLAVRQKLVQAYRPALSARAGRLSRYWERKAGALVAAPGESPPAQAFARLTASGACDAAVIYDGSGSVAYPAQFPPSGVSDAGPPAVWAQARRLLERGDTAGAVDLLAARFADEQQAEARDTAGRLIAPLAGLRALELIADPEAPRYAGLRDALAARLNDYSPPFMPPAQRRFLMHRLLETPGGDLVFPTLDGEELAADYLAGEPDVPDAAGLTPSGLPGVWRIAAEGERVVGLFRAGSFLDDMQALLREAGGMPGAAIELRRPDQRSGDEDAFLARPVGDLLPGWRLALMLEGPDPFSEAAEKQVAAYLWTSLLGIGTIVAAALVGGHILLRQAKLTRLKNDFIATVTHELKTPLAAVRMFAETLREGRYEDREQARRYLDLLVSENERLSRLIDNFLSFSRMERDRRAFDLTEAVPGEVVRGVAEVVRERLQAEGGSFEVAIEPGLPRVMADPDALATVLLNLLDNAYKYTGEDKRIALRARAGDGQVCFEVEDNGIGMSGREARKAFDRFYQADSRLSRRAAGCGLGLSIVKFIVDAHGGTIDVRSQPGEGSTFTVRLPAAQAGEEP